MKNKGIGIDRTKRLGEEPHKGHNRWHPDIPPVIEVDPGEEVTLETRDAMDLQIGPRTTVKDLEKMERTVAHPLTGPVYVKGAKPGDLLEIEYLDILPERYGWTRFSPGFGFPGGGSEDGAIHPRRKLGRDGEEEDEANRNFAKLEPILLPQRHGVAA